MGIIFTNALSQTYTSVWGAVRGRLAIELTVRHGLGVAWPGMWMLWDNLNQHYLPDMLFNSNEFLSIRTNEKRPSEPSILWRLQGSQASRLPPFYKIYFLSHRFFQVKQMTCSWQYYPMSSTSRQDISPLAIFALGLWAQSRNLSYDPSLFSRPHGLSTRITSVVTLPTFCRSSVMFWPATCTVSSHNPYELFSDITSGLNTPRYEYCQVGSSAWKLRYVEDLPCVCC